MPIQRRYLPGTRFAGSTTFKDNWAYIGGAIFNRYPEDSSDTQSDEPYTTPTITFPEDPADLVFEGNEASVSDRERILVEVVGWPRLFYRSIARMLCLGFVILMDD